ncbi:MAG: universal stress protein [Methanocellales archaeon]
MGEKFNSILIATDGSQHTKSAVKHGLALAKLSNAKVYAVYVIDIGMFASIPMDTTLENMHELLKKEGELATRSVEEEAKALGIEIEKIILEGNPAQEIVKFANANNIDLIVMGTLGKSGLERFLLGSVAEKVIRTASCPVMVVRSRAGGK